MSQAPAHWKSKNWLSVSLLPLSYIYKTLSTLRTVISRQYQSKIPIICVGNVTVGGTGKTPIVAHLAQSLKPYGFTKICIVSKGYKGKITAPTVVNIEKHTATDVGDEPLMLAQNAPVIIGKNRRKAVQLAEQMGFDLIIMDDGLQNPTVRKDKTIVVIDGYKGFENSFVIPAGPLRENPDARIKNADAILITGQKNDFSTPESKTFYTDLIVEQPPFESGQSVVPFAGIGNPDKFFETVRLLGYPIRAKVSYPDHYAFSDKDVTDLKGIAQKALAKLVTTEKDYIRLSKSQKQDITPIPIVLKISPDGLEKILTKNLKAVQ